MAKGKTARIGLAGYARLLAKLRDTPCTLAEAPTILGVGHNCAWRFIAGMHSMGLIHICDWRMPPRCAAVPVFTAGAGVDAQPPALRPNGRPSVGARVPSTRKPAPELMAFKALLAAIESPSSRQEIAASTGMRPVTVRNAVQALVTLRLAHIAMWEWRDHGGPPIPQYEIGASINASRPQPMRKRAVQARYVQRQAEVAKFTPLASVFSTRPMREVAEVA